MKRLMTALTPTQTWSNPFKDYTDLIAETEHYAIVHNPNADKFTEASHYLVVFKERNTIESRDGAYVVAMAHMADAESMYTALSTRNEYPKKVKTVSNESLN